MSRVRGEYGHCISQGLLDPPAPLSSRNPKMTLLQGSAGRGCERESDALEEEEVRSLESRAEAMSVQNITSEVFWRQRARLDREGYVQRR